MFVVELAESLLSPDVGVPEQEEAVIVTNARIPNRKQKIAILNETIGRKTSLLMKLFLALPEEFIPIPKLHNWGIRAGKMKRTSYNHIIREIRNKA